jgi:2-oxoglutarate ferredoxin oxidoreductase subunit alpha
VPGTKGSSTASGGIEKQHETGNISYEPLNHEFMVKLRAEKLNVADYIPLQKLIRK